MNKRTFALYALLLVAVFHIRANPVSETDALRLASNFHQLRFPSKLRSSVALTLVRKGMDSRLRSSSDPAFYIYNIGLDEGFVIISGEDATKVVLGYADEGSFQPENMPENLKHWLNFYQQEIEAVRSAAAPAVATSEVSSIATGTTTVAPLLGSIKWNQTEPFNLLCPWDAATSSHTLAGCVAVAMSQIMRYYRWPSMGKGTHSYTDATYGLQSVDLSKTTYDWDNMLGYYGGSSTEAQDAAVATLMYQCGVAVDMAYSTSGSSSTISKASEAFVNHFGYDTEIQRYERPYYTSDEWNNLIKNELNNARPVYFSANSDAGGHAFVCDGYDSNNLFHINWGWGGSSNGYFELSSLSSNNPGVVGAAPEYCYLQSILANIHPVDSVNKTTNQVNVYKIGLSSSVSSVSKISTSRFTLTFGFGNLGTELVNFRWGIGYIKDGSTTLTKLIEYSSSTYDILAPGSYYPSQSLNVINPTALSTAGVYRLYPIYLPKGSSTWSIMRGTPALNNCMVVKVANTNGSATILPALGPPSLTLTGAALPLSRIYQNKTLNVDVTIKNNGQEFFSRVGLCLVNATDPGDRTYICESKVLCPAGETKTFHLTGTVNCPPGDYYMEAQFDSTNSNSTLNYKTFGPSNLNNQQVKVLPPPGLSVLHLNGGLTMNKGVVVLKDDTIDLTASISNSGGYFDSRIIAFVFPKAGGRSITYLPPKFVNIDSLDTKEVTLTGVPDLSPGEYSFSIYAYLNNTWNLLTPNALATLPFTVSDGSLSIQKTAETVLVRQNNRRVYLDTKANIQQAELFDLYGRIVVKTASEREISLEGLAPGLYLLHVQSDGKTIHERILIH